MRATPWKRRREYAHRSHQRSKDGSPKTTYCRRERHNNKAGEPDTGEGLQEASKGNPGGEYVQPEETRGKEDVQISPKIKKMTRGIMWSGRINESAVELVLHCRGKNSH